MSIDYGTHDVSTSGSLAISNLRINDNIIGVKTNNQDIQILSSGNGNVYLGPIYTDGINAFANPKADSGFDVTVRNLYISEGLGFYEAGDNQGQAIVFDKGGLTSHSLRVNNGGGNGGSIFKASADGGVEMQGVVKIDKLGGDFCSLTVDGSGLFNNGISTSNLNTSATYTEKVSQLSIVSSGLTIPLSSGNLFTTNLNSSISGVTLSDVPSTSGVAMGFSLIFTADGTARSVTWPASVKWPGGTAPTLTSTNAKRDVLSFVSTDNGTSWLGFVGGQNY